MQLTHRRISAKSMRKRRRRSILRGAVEFQRATATVAANLPVFHTLEELRDALEMCDYLPRMIPWLIYALPKTESPIERQMVFALALWCVDAEPQFRIGKYRLDFALIEEKVAIELDGHEFHSSKEARTRDAERDRFLTGDGWRVLRFTGTEVWRDASKCAAEICALSERGPGERLSAKSITVATALTY